MTPWILAGAAAVVSSAGFVYMLVSISRKPKLSWIEKMKPCEYRDRILAERYLNLRARQMGVQARVQIASPSQVKMLSSGVK